MTLLVTEASRVGVVMMADTLGNSGPDARSGFAKIVHGQGQNVLLGAWGKASVGSGRIDCWLVHFLTGCPATLSVHELGNRLVERLNRDLAATGRSWPHLGRRGIHIGGFAGNQAVLYHAHMGSEQGPIGPLQLEDSVALVAAAKGLTPEQVILERRAQLRNGVYPAFQEVFDKDLELSGWGDFSSVQARVDHYRPLFIQTASRIATIDERFNAAAITVSGVVIEPLAPCNDVGVDEPDTQWLEGLAFAANSSLRLTAQAAPVLARATGGRRLARSVRLGRGS